MVYFHVIVTHILGLIIYYLIIVIFIQDLPSVKLINLLFVSIKSFPVVITILETLPFTLKFRFLCLSPEALNLTTGILKIKFVSLVRHIEVLMTYTLIWIPLMRSL